MPGSSNVPDMFTRLLFSLVVTGIAPATFYAQDATGGRPRGRYEGLAVDFLAGSITAIGARHTKGFYSYNLSSAHDDGISLDNFVDWLIDGGMQDRTDRSVRRVAVTLQDRHACAARRAAAGVHARHSRALQPSADTRHDVPAFIREVPRGIRSGGLRDPTSFIKADQQVRRRLASPPAAVAKQPARPHRGFRSSWAWRASSSRLAAPSEVPSCRARRREPAGP